MQLIIAEMSECIKTRMHARGKGMSKEERIRDANAYEVSRGGQVYFVHNRLQNIKEVAGMIQRLCPGVRVAIGHG